MDSGSSLDQFRQQLSLVLATVRPVTYSVPLAINDFPGWFPTPANLDVSDEMLVWAAATLGERRRAPRNSDLLRRSNRRVAALSDAFATRCRRHLAPSSNYADNLDPSERAQVSYLLGGISAKLTSAHLAGVPYLVHYDTVLRENRQPLVGQRPDFVGVGIPPLSARVTVEAKGTVGGRNGALGDAVGQAKGRAGKQRHRRLAWGQQAHFTSAGCSLPVWAATLVDPPVSEFEFPKDVEVLLAYFRPLVTDIFADGFVEVGNPGSKWRVAVLGDAEVQIAIRSDLAIAAEESDGEQLQVLCGMDNVRQSGSEPRLSEAAATLATNPVERWGTPDWPDETSREGRSIVGPDGISVRVSTNFLERLPSGTSELEARH